MSKTVKKIMITYLLLGVISGVWGCWSPQLPFVGGSSLEHYREGRMESWTTADGLPADAVTALLVTDESIWVGTERGLAVLNRVTGEWEIHTTENSRLPHNHITALARDTRGRIWIGTNKRGLVRIGRYNWDVFDTDDELPSNVINCIVAEPSGDGLDDDNVWIGTKRGLARYNADGWFVYTAPSFFAALHDNAMLDDDVNCIAVDDAFLWVGGARGLCRYNDVNWRKWTPDGALDIDKMEFQGPDRYPINEEEIVELGWDGKESLYVAARRSEIAVYDGSDWYPIEIESGASLKAMVVGPDSELWVARHNPIESASDLRRYDPQTDTWQIVTVEEGLPSNRVLTLVLEGNDLWIGTERGLAHLIREDVVPVLAPIDN